MLNWVTMRLADIIPQPFRNIAYSYTELKRESISQKESIQHIEKIAKDIFRLFLVIPLIATTLMLSGLEGGIYINLGLLLVLPQSQLIAFAAMSSVAATALLVHGLATASGISFTGAFVFGLVAYFASEKYEKLIPYSLEDHFITPLSSRIAEFLV